MSDKDEDGEESTDERLEKGRQNLEGVLGPAGEASADAAARDAERAAREREQAGQPKPAPEPEPEPEPEPDVSGPAFGFEDVGGESVYVRPSTWAAYRATREQVRSELMGESELEDVEKREIDDAVLRSASAEEIKQAVLEARREP